MVSIHMLTWVLEIGDILLPLRISSIELIMLKSKILLSYLKINSNKISSSVTCKVHG